MGLKDVKRRTETVEVNGATFEVSGFSLTALVTLVDEYLPDAKEFASADFNMRRLAVRSPNFVAHLIANAAGDPEASEQAANLPIGTQIDALNKIWHLSVGDDSEAVYETILDALQGFNGLADRLEEIETTAGRMSDGVKKVSQQTGGEKAATSK